MAVHPPARACYPPADACPSSFDPAPQPAHAGAVTHAPGTIIGGRHRIEALIGQGGFGAVFRATQLTLDRPVALKVLLPDALGDEGLARFQREAEIVQRLEHPNVVRLLDFGVAAGGEPFLVFELLSGQTLEEAIRTGGPLSPARAARVGKQVLKALMEAHAQGIVHRDIKPANIFLCNFQGEPDFVKVLDFGIAKGRDSRTLTGRGGVIGTPAYMAPEQVNGGGITFAADLFALGLTLEEALTGRVVYKDFSLVDIVREHLSPSPVPHAPDAISSPLGPILHRATLKRAEMRYPSAGEMLAHLEAAMSFATASGVVAVPSGGISPSLNMAYSPTALPDTAPIVLGEMAKPQGSPVVRSMAATPGVLVPPPPARSGKKGARPWVLMGAIGGGVVLLGGGLAGVIAMTGVPSGSPARTSSSSVPTKESASTTRESFTLGGDDSLAEVDANGDGVPDVVGFCSDLMVSVGPVSLCAFDGATFRMLWQRPLGIDTTVTHYYTLGGSGRAAVLVDPQGIVHIHDAASGVELSAIRLGAKVEHMCAPTDGSGKYWFKTTERGVVVDAVTRTARDAPRPASCTHGRRETGCHGRPDPELCPEPVTEPFIAGVSIDHMIVEGKSAVAVGHKKSDSTFRMLIGFDPQPPRRLDDDPKIFWQRPVAPGDGLGAVGSSHFGDFDVRAGRAVTAYDDIAGKTHVVMVDVASGRRLWDVVSPSFRGLVLRATRVYVARWTRLEARDAATGQLLGGVGTRL